MGWPGGCCSPAIGYGQPSSRSLQRQRDPWEPFRLWLAFTIGLYAIRAFFAATWVGALPGWVLLVLVLIALALASMPCSFPGAWCPIARAMVAGGTTYATTGSCGGAAGAGSHEQPISTAGAGG